MRAKNPKVELFLTSTWSRPDQVYPDKGAWAGSPIEVRDISGFKGVFAKEEIMEDSVVFVLKGTISEHPTRYTIELGKNRHLNFPTVRTANDDLDFCWQFLNHSCEPNGYMSIADQTFRASRTIRRGEEKPSPIGGGEGISSADELDRGAFLDQARDVGVDGVVRYAAHRYGDTLLFVA